MDAIKFAGILLFGIAFWAFAFRMIGNVVEMIGKGIQRILFIKA